MPFYSLLLAALPFAVPSYLRTLQRVCSLSHCLQLRFLRHGSSCVLRNTSFIRSFTTLHSTTFVAIQFASWHGLHCKHTIQHRCSHIPFRKTNATILTGFHYASFRRHFISVLLSPPAANYFARRQPHFGFAQLVNTNCSVRPSLRKVSLSFACIVPPPTYTS